jgi:hypothetical protein
MSCSWQDFYSISNHSFIIEQSECDKNFPIVLKLAPKQSKTTKLRVYLNKKITTTNRDCKIGFHLVPQQTFTDNYDFQQQLNKNILWSNSITL